MIRRFASRLATALLVAIVTAGSLGMVSPPNAATRPGDATADRLTPFPRLANIYYDNPAPVLDKLARWDIVVLANGYPDSARALRRFAPSLQMLVYQLSEETPTPGTGSTDPRNGFDPAWWLQSARGIPYYFWDEHRMVNSSAAAPEVNGQRWSQHVVDWIAKNAWSEGVWDGVFFDNSWEHITWRTEDYGVDVDLDRNGVNDFDEHGPAWIDRQWGDGVRQLMTAARARFGKDAIIIGGSVNAQGTNNGRMIEDFPRNFQPDCPASCWEQTMKEYWAWQRQHFGRFVWINNTYPDKGRSGQSEYQLMRYALTSTLLGDGYFSFDESVYNHAGTWWYDEYAVDWKTAEPTDGSTGKGYLGFPVGPATRLANGLWRRDFDRGIVLTNPTSDSRWAALGEPFRHIRGKQDPQVNDGELVDRVMVPARDGVILLRQVNGG